MRIHADAVVTDERNQALFILRRDTRTWSQPGGAVEAGETAKTAVAREVEEETGLKVMPVRLVGLYYRAARPDDLLLFTFRCIKRGGLRQTSAESLLVHFLPTTPLPTPMLAPARERLQRALAHRGGPPYWGTQRLTPGLRLLMGLIQRAAVASRFLPGIPTYGMPLEWSAGAFTVLRDQAGRVLWVRRRDHNVWNLPGGRRERGEPPWQTAVRETREETGLEVALQDLTGVYTKPPHTVVFTFTATATGGKLAPTAEAADFAYFAPGDEPPNSLAKHRERVADAVSREEETIFREQTAPATDLAALAQNAVADDTIHD